MREVYPSDITAAVRVLLGAPPQARTKLCCQLLNEADWADKFTKRLRRPHPIWGNGTLAAAAQARMRMPERSFSDREYIACFMIALDGLQRHRAAKTCKPDLQTHIENKLHHGFAFG